MKMDLPNWAPNGFVLWIITVFGIAFLIGGIVLLINLTRDLSQNIQAQVLATVLGSAGTVLLALATFINISQTNRTLKLKEKEREKPLIVDELSYVIQPAISSFKNNLREIRDFQHSGCAFDWVYIRNPSGYSGSAGPDPIRTPDTLSMARLTADDRKLAANLRAHDEYVKDIVEKANKLHEELKPEIERLLEEEAINDISQDLRVITSAVLKELDYFDDSHELYDFWEEHRENLIKYANEETETTLDEVKADEINYQDRAEKVLQQLSQRKANLKHDYSISEDEITSESDYLFSR